MTENIKKISDWQVLTPSGWQDFEGVKKVSKPYALKITLEDDSFVICSGGHQLYVLDKETDESSHLFADLIQPFVMSIETQENSFQTVIDVEKLEEEQDLFDLVNVAHGYEYYTNDIVSHNCAHVDGIDDLWLGLWPTLSCLVGTTRVFTNKGIFKIEDFHKDRAVGEYFEIESGWEVYGKDGLETLSHGYVSPDSETRKLTTKHGYEVEATLKHPLWRLDSVGGSMCPAKDLQIGDYLRVQIGMSCYGENKLDSDLAYMLGGYIAEGNCVKAHKGDFYSVQITNFDDEFQNVYKDNGLRLLGKVFKGQKSKPGKLFCHSKAAIKKLIERGIVPEHKCYQKITPKSIWTATKEAQVNYLSGLFDGDGSVSSRGVNLTSTSKLLIQETQLLLLNMGYYSNIQYIESGKILAREQKSGRLMPGGKSLKTLRDAWALNIPRSQLQKFGCEIGFRITRKQKRIEALAKKYRQQEDLKQNLVPASIAGPMIQKMKNEAGITDIWLRERGLRFDKWKSSSKKGERFLTADWIKRFRSLVDGSGLIESPEQKTFFDNIIGNFFWDKIEKIEKSSAKTYDFTVPDTHTFVQNGILGSNTGGSAILISSPSGVGTLFHKIWVGAKNGEDGDGKPNPGKGTNSFYRVELPWTVHPERDEAWFQSQRDEILPAKGERGVAQELLCSFAASGENFLSGDVLEDMEKQILPPMATYGDRGNAWIWKYAEPGHKYIASADVSRGDADDFSTIIVIDTNSDEVVCEYQGKCPPEQLAELLLDLGGKYNNALLCPELNSFGMIVATALKKSTYPNVYYDKIHKNAYMGYTTADIQDDLPGWTTGPKNRDEMLAKLETVIRTKRIKIYSSRLVEEFKTFIWKNNKAQAMKGYSDDLVIALAIGNSLYEASGVNAWDAKELTMAMLSGMSKGTVTMSPIGSAGGFGQSSTINMPPIMTSEGVRTVAQLQDFQNKREVAKQGPQNMRNPYYAQWAWVSYEGPKPEKK